MTHDPSLVRAVPALLVLVALVVAPVGGVAAAATPGTSAGTASSFAGADVPAGAAGATPPLARALQTCSFPVTSTDATGTRVTVEAAPERVVTLAPSAAQTMWEIGARDRVVGVSGYAGYLEGAGSRTNVSGAGQSLVSVEAVVGLDPDLVLAPNVVTNETVERLRGAGLTVYRFPPATAVGGSDPGWGLTVVEKTRLTGELVGACDGAARSVRTMEAQLDQVRRATESRERPRVLYVFFGFTAGEGTFVDEVITLAGGENVAASVGLAGYQRISPETVVAEDPEWIVLNSDAPAVPRSDAYNSTTAVREGNTVVLDADEISQPAPRIVVPIRTLAEALHPGAVAALTADPSGSPSASTPPPTPTPEPDPTPTASTTTFAVDDTPSDGSADGFGFGVALAALAVLGLLAILAALRNRDRGGGDGPA